MRVITDRSTVASFAASAVAVLAAVAVSRGANADIVPCGADACTSSFSIFVDGSSVESGGGQLVYNATTGEITLDTANNVRGGGMLDPTTGGLMWDMGGGLVLRVGSLSGNADPILGFSVATTTGGTGTTVAFAFNLPIALSGLIRADAQVSYSLTSLSAAGAQISAIGAPVVQAFEVDTTVGGLGSLNKGVDVGSTFFVLGGPANATSPTYSATNFFTGSSAYDLMSVRVAYALSPNSAVGLSGFVQQVLVPLPAALPLLLSGVIGLGALARRRHGAALASRLTISSRWMRSTCSAHSARRRSRQ